MDDLSQPYMYATYLDLEEGTGCSVASHIAKSVRTF